MDFLMIYKNKSFTVIFSPNSSILFSVLLIKIFEKKIL